MNIGTKSINISKTFQPHTTNNSLIPRGFLPQNRGHYWETEKDTKKEKICLIHLRGKNSIWIIYSTLVK